MHHRKNSSSVPERLLSWISTKMRLRRSKEISKKHVISILVRLIGRIRKHLLGDSVDILFRWFVRKNFPVTLQRALRTRSSRLLREARSVLPTNQARRHWGREGRSVLPTNQVRRHPNRRTSSSRLMNQKRLIML